MQGGGSPVAIYTQKKKDTGCIILYGGSVSSSKSYVSTINKEIKNEIKEGICIHEGAVVLHKYINKCL